MQPPDHLRSEIDTFSFTSSVEEKISQFLLSHFGLHEFNYQIEKQQKVYENEEDITGVLTVAQEVSRMEGKPFEADIDLATNRATMTLRIGVIMLLKNAYVSYKNNKEIQCIRYLLIALGYICDSLGWKKASSYISQQNEVLFKMELSEEADS